MLGSAVLLNNIQRQFPIYWWTATDLRSLRAAHKTDGDIEKDPARIARVPTRQAPAANAPNIQHFAALDRDYDIFDTDRGIRILAHEVFIPDWLEVSNWEKQVLEVLSTRLQDEGASSIEAKASRDSSSDVGV